MVRSFEKSQWKNLCLWPSIVGAPSQRLALRSKCSFLSKGVPFFLIYYLCFSGPSTASVTSVYKTVLCLPMYCRTLFALESPGGFVKLPDTGLQFKNPDSVGLGWDVMLCIYYKFSCAADAIADVQGSFSEPLGIYFYHDSSYNRYLPPS